MLFKRQHLEGIENGAITLAFRRWKRPTVRAGGTLRTPVGVLAIGRVDRIGEADITDADARRAGFACREALLEQLRKRTYGELYRIELRWSCADPRDELRQRTRISGEEAAEISQQLARYDTASRHGPWTRATLQLIGERPNVKAGELAASAGFAKPWFKANVRKLKACGLTESLEVGYRLSPRGRAFLETLRGRHAT